MSAESPLCNRNASRFQLIETLRWQPQSGFLRLDRHLARLALSAKELGFACDTNKAAQALEQAIVNKNTPQRMRLLLGPDGQVEASAQPFQPLAHNTIWTLKLAKTQLSSQNPLIRHKTTQRALYERARAEYAPAQADEVLLQNERGQICEGTITSLFVDMGNAVLTTPPLACGVLAGVLRGELIAQGRAVEGIVTPESLQMAQKIFVGNSLRGLIRACLSLR
ncbi:aminotransferase class IV family protein [Aquamicrobium segne]|uniref:Probable branched-chain-amino-acid aminotransferase n=1 Tax=Aquamicrobium segne TaxID=469547 RepID=A0ABW0GWV0_9HYPH